MKTIGHCAGNGGLRGHSVGELFPYVFVLKGTPDRHSFWVRRPDGEEVFIGRKTDDFLSITCADAYQRALAYKELREILQ